MFAKRGKKVQTNQEDDIAFNDIFSINYDSEIQKCVVMMKDELEKAKEQILNVL